MDGYPFAEVAVFMEDAASAWFDITPVRMELGVVRFGGWDVRPAPDVTGAYLVRLTAEFERATLAPRPMWWEAGLDFDGATVTGSSRPRWRFTADRARTDFVLLPGSGVREVTLRAVATCQPAPVDSRGFIARSEPVRCTMPLAPSDDLHK